MSRTLQVACKCGRTFQVPSSLRGVRIRCRSCGAHLLVPKRDGRRILGIGIMIASFGLMGAGIYLVASGDEGLQRVESAPGPRTVDVVVPPLARALAQVPRVPRTLIDSVAQRVVSCDQLGSLGRLSRPATGFEFRGGKWASQNELVVRNSSGRDALVLIRRPVYETTVRTTFVRTGTSVTIQRIPSGTYEVLFMFGRGWLSELGSFCEDRSYSRFDDLFEFQETYNTYAAWEVTLHPVVGGTAETSPTDPSAFEGVTQ